MMRGKFITFEGVDGSGKTTILKMIMDKFIEEKIIVESTREPGGENILCEKIRELLLDDNYDIAFEVEALLFAASRSQHVSKYIIPKIESGSHIISDRFIDSSLVYQGFGRGLGYKNIENINKFAINKFEPDLTIFFDVPIDLGFERISKYRKDEINKLDKDSIEMKQKIYDGYKNINKLHKKRIKVIDASKSINQVFEEVYKLVKDLILKNEK